MSRKDKPSKSAYGFAKKCPYCGANVVLRDSHYVYHNNKNYGKIWLSAILHIPQEECHIGMFDVKTCRRVVEICKKQDNKVLSGYRKKNTTPRYTRGYKR